MRTVKLLTGVAVVALMATASNAWADPVTMQDINQDSTNSSIITNNGTADVGVVSGRGATVNIGGSGAISSVSVSSTENDDAVTTNVTFGAINQITNNTGIVNNGVTSGSITTGDISGAGASATISANGAVSSVSVSSIEDTQPMGSVTVGDAINQQTTNSGIITNRGTVTSEKLTGNSSSISITAAGAASVVSVSTNK